MAKKCPKNFKIFQQKTLAETWFCKQNSNTKADEKDKSSDSDAANDQCESDDSDFVASSQDKSKSKFKILRSTRQAISSTEKVKQSVSCKSKSKEILPKTPKQSMTDKKLSISDVCEANSNIIKEEVDEMFENVNDFDSIEMRHDLSGLIADKELPLNAFEANDKNIEENEGQEEQDPLFIDVKKKKILVEKENRKINKTINANKRKKKQGHLVSKKSQLILKKKRPVGNKKKGFSEKVLRTLHVKLQHTVPPQHKIENCAGSRPLNEQQMSLFESYGPLKRGSFTKAEDKLIKQNWINFCELHNWDEKCVEPFLNMRHEGKYYIPNIEERKNFVRFLSNGLPWRSLYSVYHRFKNLYNNSVNVGPYTAAEDKKIIECIYKGTPSKINKKCAELAKILNRKRHSIWQRYQKLKVNYNLECTRSDDSSDNDLESEGEQNSENKNKNSSSRIKKPSEDGTFKKVYKEVKWSYPLVSRFIEKLMETMSCEDIEELKNQTIDDEIWKKMEEKISIDRTVLENFWNLQLHMQLFCSKPLYLNDLKIDLIEYLYKNKESSDSLEWDKMKLAFNGVTPAFLSKVFDHLVKYVKTKFGTDDIKITDVVEYLYNTHIPELEEKTIDAVLPKLYCKNGRIVSVDKADKRPSKGTTANPLSDEEYEN